MTYPISEIFASIAGEGFHVGAPMTFIRLAGCCVGKPYTEQERAAQGLEVYQDKCTDFQGNSFACDTNYRAAQKMTEQEITSLDIVKSARHICITGGEPLMYDLEPLAMALSYLKGTVHIETSGTRKLPKSDSGAWWVAVSPKISCLPAMLHRADEVKILVGPNFDEQQFTALYERFKARVYFQPVNGLNTIDKANYARCVELALKYGGRVSVQVHKLLGER